jgi:hypothetical protein
MFVSIIDVVLEDPLGGAVEKAHGRTWLFGPLLQRIEPGTYPLIKYIDMYGDTIFNRLQMTDFLAGWRQLRALASNPEEAALLDEVERLATTCQEIPGHYLKFYGD